MKILDLFSGIGGFSLGLEWTGMETVAFCEIDPFCQEVLKKHWPHVPIFDDIKSLTKQTLIDAEVMQDGSTIDVICGGFPCQPFSTAGKRGGEDDDRYLWPEMLRVIRDVKPTWVIAENVRGLISQDGGLAFERVLSDLENAGYETQPFIIPACAVNASHRRDRVWIVAHSRNGSGRDGESRSSGRDGAGELEKAQWTPKTVEIARSSEAQSIISNPESREGWRIQQSRLQPDFGADNQNARNTPSQRLPDWAGGEMGQPRPLTEFERPDGREVERDFRGVAHGVSSRVDRLRSLGNAVVPQVVEMIGRAIMEAEGNAWTYRN